MFGTFRCPEQAVAVRAGAREEVTPASGRRDISFRKPRLFRDELIQNLHRTASDAYSCKTPNNDNEQSEETY